MPTETLIRDARLPGSGERVDVRVAGGRVVTIADGVPPAGARVADAGGAFLVPGLWDAHVHVLQWARVRRRLDLSATTGAGDVLALVADHLARVPGQDLLVGFGFRDALWTDPPTLAALDRVAGGTAVVLICGDMHSAWLSSAAARRFGVAVGADGRVREQPWFAAVQQVDAPAPGDDRLVDDALAAAARRGLVGLVDLDLADNVASWRRRFAAGIGGMRVRAGIYPERLGQAVAAGLRTGDPIEGTGGLATVGPLKVISDGSLGTRTAYCRHPYAGSTSHGTSNTGTAELVELLSRARAAGITGAVHAIGDLAITAALDAYAASGHTGSIEHAQLVDAADVPRFAALGITASVQPEHAMDDRDATERYWPTRAGRAFPLAELVGAGATLRFGSDAPVAPLDPWAAMAAAVTRTRDGREPWHPEHRIGRRVALAASADGRDRVRVGDVADLVLTEHDPLDARTDLRGMRVRGTMLAGEWTYWA